MVQSCSRFCLELDLVFQHNVANGVFNTDVILSYINFQIPCRIIRNGCAFYVYLTCKASPMTCLLILFNKIASFSMNISDPTVSAGSWNIVATMQCEAPPPFVLVLFCSLMLWDSL